MEGPNSKNKNIRDVGYIRDKRILLLNIYQPLIN